jgi:hypothetical protein
VAHLDTPSAKLTIVFHLDVSKRSVCEQDVVVWVELDGPVRTQKTKCQPYKKMDESTEKIENP